MTNYCTFCDNEAMFETQDEELDHVTYLCRTCADAFEYGQISPNQGIWITGENKE